MRLGSGRVCDTPGLSSLLYGDLRRSRFHYLGTYAISKMHQRLVDYRL